MGFSGDGPWELPLTGFRVEHVTFAMSVSIGLQGDDANAMISLPGAFDFEQPESASITLTRRLSPGMSWPCCSRCGIVRSPRHAGRDSALRVEF